MTTTDLKETNAPGVTARNICAYLKRKGETATRIGSGGGILECRLIDGDWHYFVAAEYVQVPGANIGVMEFKMYAEPGELP